MGKQEEIREGTKAILTDDLITWGWTHENPPPGKDCGEECGVSLDDQIAASNPFCSPVRSGGKKHKRCMECWEEYIDGLVARIQAKEKLQGVVIKVREAILSKGVYNKSSFTLKRETVCTAVEPLIEE